MENVFINEAFENTIKEYIKLQKEPNEIIDNSFSMMVFKMLAHIYGEIDIINPYIIHNEKSFRQNIIKFGYSIEDYEKFKNDFLEYYKIENENSLLSLKKKNVYFVEVQKDLINMFFKKKRNYRVTLDEEKQFFEMLYTSKTLDPLRVSYNFLTAIDTKEVENYFYDQMENDKPEPPKKSNVLNIEAYEILNYSLTDIANMDSDSVDKINESVYEFFQIDEDEEDKSSLLNIAIDNYKKSKSKLTSGNGYVDILLVMGVVVTGIMVLTIATFVIL